MTSDAGIIVPQGLALPKGMRVPEVKIVDKDGGDIAEGTKSQLIPRPTGYRILCVVPKASQEHDGTGILKADTTIRAEEASTSVLFVMEVGPDAYKDAAKFPSGPWCKKGDFVLVRTYSGTRFRVFGQEFRVLNDDQIEGVVDDPRGVTRA